MKESKCPLEVVRPTDGFQYTVNGGIALIDVGSSEHPAVWQVPASRLQWALSLYPVRLKELPATESPVTREIRLQRRRLARDGWRMTTEQKDGVIRQLNDLELRKVREYPPAPRYFLVKSIDGVEAAVHRLFVDATRDDEVEAVDGDFLNFTTARVKVTVEPVVTSGLTVAKGNRPPAVITEEVVVPNLYVVNNDAAQIVFEDSASQLRVNADCGTASPDDPPPAKPVRPEGASGADAAKNSEQAAWDRSQKG
jgi:hypothetical protein